MVSPSCFVPPYVFRRRVVGGVSVFVLEVLGLGRFVFRSIDEMKRYLENGSDFFVSCVLRDILGSGRLFSHLRPVSCFRDAVVVFSFVVGGDPLEALGELEGGCCVFAPDRTVAICSRDCDFGFLRSLVRVGVSFKGQDVLLRRGDRLFIYKEFLRWRRFFNVYRFYVPDGVDEPPLVGEFKYGYLVKAPFVKD